MKHQAILSVLVFLVVLTLDSAELRGQNQLANGSVNDSIARLNPVKDPAPVLAGSAQDPGAAQAPPTETPVLGPGSGDQSSPSEQNQDNSPQITPRRD